MRHVEKNSEISATEPIDSVNMIKEMRLQSFLKKKIKAL